MDLNLRLKVGGSRMPTARDSWTRAVPRALLSFLLSGTSSRGFICCRIGDVTCSYKRMLHIVLHRLLTLCCLHVHACDSCAFLLAPPAFFLWPASSAFPRKNMPRASFLVYIDSLLSQCVFPHGFQQLPWCLWAFQKRVETCPLHTMSNRSK